jgi:hypothetical protein
MVNGPGAQVHTVTAGTLGVEHIPRIPDLPGKARIAFLTTELKEAEEF